MRLNRRAITKGPLADSWYSAQVGVTTIYDRLPERGPLTREAFEVTRETFGERLKFRTRNRMRLSERAIPRATDKTPGDTRALRIRYDLIEASQRKRERVKRGKPIVIGSTMIGGKRNVKNAFKRFFPEWQNELSAPISNRLSAAKVKRVKQARRVKLASETEREAFAKAERVRNRAKSKRAQARKRKLTALAEQTFIVPHKPSANLEAFAALMVVGW